MRPEDVAACYGVTVNDPAPRVSIVPTDDVRGAAWYEATRRAALRAAGMDPSERWELDHGLNLDGLLEAWNEGDQDAIERWVCIHLTRISPSDYDSLMARVYMAQADH